MRSGPHPDRRRQTDGGFAAIERSARARIAGQGPARRTPGMVAHLPLTKLAGLLVRQVARPIVKVLQERLKQNATFTRNITRLATGYQRFELNLRRRMMGLGTTGATFKMEPQQALDLVVDLVGESLVIAAAASIVAIEYSRCARSPPRAWLPSSPRPRHRP